MKKQLLFIHPTMQFGGAEKSLQTLLSLLDYEKYDVDLLLFRRDGSLLELLPEQVRLIELPQDAQTFSMPIAASCKTFLKQGKLKKALARLRFSNAVRGDLSARRLEQRGWYYQKKAYTPLSREYDAAIAYLEGSPIYFCADCVRAKKKIAYIHSDYKKLQMDDTFDRAYFEKMDALVAVSEGCADSLRGSFPEFAEKVCVIENIIAPQMIAQKAAEPADFGDDYEGMRLLTMGRLDEPKGIDMAVEVCAALAAEADFRWYVLGDGPQKAELTAKIAENHLEDRFILLGTRLNPYPYLQACDIYVQPSRFEGKSIALEEAKALRKPILTTAFTTVADQITDGETGSVAEISVQSLTEKLRALLRSADLRQKYSDALRNYDGNISEIEKFYGLL